MIATTTDSAVSLTGNEAAAWAVAMARASVAYSFPMGPNTEVTETLQKLVDTGRAPGMRVIYGESEKAAQSMQIASARLGVRTMSCINSEGLLWATAEIHYMACSRLPGLLVCPSRALEPPTTVYSDHDDFVSQRDMGWLMFYCSDPQDAFDTILQAYKVSEHASVMLPAIVGYDGWEVSHATTRVRIPVQEQVDRFLPAPDFIAPEKDYLGVDWRERFSSRRLQDAFGAPDFMELRHLQKRAETDSAAVIEEVGREFRDAFGSPNVGLLDSYCCDDAEIIVLTMGVISPTVRLVVDALRARGVQIGCLKLRVFRPFPAAALADAVGGARLVVTVERNCLAALYTELRSALFSSLSSGGRSRPPMVMGRIVGMGGAPIPVDHVRHIVEEARAALAAGHIERELDWHPIRGIDFDPRCHVIGE